MLTVKEDAKELIETIITHSRYGVVDPRIIASQYPEHTEHHIAFVLEQIAQTPFPDLLQLVKNNQ